VRALAANASGARFLKRLDLEQNRRREAFAGPGG
jgi:hypothetical protein